MFTVEQIKTAHGKVKSGADFPAYIQEIKGMGVTSYTAYVCDGHIDYRGENNYLAKVPAKYESKTIADKTDTGRFQAELKAHQQGKTNYQEFISMCAETGIDQWIVRMDQMTCTYYDKKGREVLVEQIPH